MFQVATIFSFWDSIKYSWKSVDFAKIWPLTSHNWVTYWPRIPKRSTNREQSSIRSRRLFRLSSKTLSFEARGGGGSYHPPPFSCTFALWRRPCACEGYKTKTYIVKWTISEYFLKTGPLFPKVGCLRWGSGQDPVMAQVWSSYERSKVKFSRSRRFFNYTWCYLNNNKS